jgi:hypothetical protein
LYRKPALQEAGFFNSPTRIKQLSVDQTFTKVRNKILSSIKTKF